MNEINAWKEKKREDEWLTLKSHLSRETPNEGAGIFDEVMKSNENIKQSKIFKKGTLNAGEWLFEAAKIASEIKKEENDVYWDFLKHTSNYEDAVDIEKMKRIIPEPFIIRSMNEDSFNEWREKVFHTKLSFIDKAID